MLFFLDENFPLRAASKLQSLGHTTIRALDHFEQGSTDEELFLHSKKSRAIFLTTDKDFYHTIPMKCDTTDAIIIVVAVSKPNTENIIQRLLDFINTIELGEISQGIFLVNDKKIYKRHVNECEGK
jgi:predicted nuclease of predicted toxin-antitoxin system